MVYLAGRALLRDTKKRRNLYRMSRIVFQPVSEALTAKAKRRVHAIIRDPMGLPNGKHRRTRLDAAKAEILTRRLIDALHFALPFAADGGLPNRIPGRGRPPDNAVFIFIDDIMRACEAAGLKPGLRFVAGSESLPVRLYNELAPILWPGHPLNPRRLFERWQRHRLDLVRMQESAPGSARN